MPVMIKRVVKSFGHAREGFMHALRRERNFRNFFFVYFAVLLPYATFSFLLSRWEVTALLLAGSTFLSVELLNTALERLTDTVDEMRGKSATGFHHGLKATKDVASAASLVSLIMVMIVLILVLGPHLLMPL